MPLAEWFAGDFGGYVEGLWRDGSARDAGLLDPAAVQTVIDDHRAGRRDEGRFLFTLAMFALWWEHRPPAARSAAA